MTNFLTNFGIVATVVIVFVMIGCVGIAWFGHQFLFDRMNAAETRISVLQRRATIAEDRMNVLVKRLGGTPTRIQKHYTDPLSNGLPGDDEWPLTPEEFEELQRKLREEKEREKTEQNTQP